jgi:membrane protein required for colicin V production
MIFDVCCVMLLCLAIFNGLRKGLVAAAFSLLGIFLGLFIARHFSQMLGSWFRLHYQYEGKWVIIGAYVALFIGTIIVMRLIGKMIETALSLALLGWANKLGGIIFYLFFYAILLIVFLQYALNNWPELPNQLSDSYCFAYAKNLAEIFMINNFLFSNQ